jgi:cobalt/nickel transport system permease protein
MGAGHVHRLHQAGDSLVHRLRPQCKLVAAVAFVFVVVSTPREQVWAFGLYALLLVGVATLAGIGPRTILTRLLVEIPFVVFAVLLPFLSPGERVDVAGVSLSVGGLWAAWNILAKSTLGVACSILLAATTDIRELLLGLERLRMPSLLVQIMTFMIRYGDVITDEMRRMRIARESRGFVGRDVRQLPVVAQSAGALFIRSYERGERVHLAMLSRGYTGRMPVVTDVSALPRDWVRALALPSAALVVCVLSWSLR